MAHRTPTLRIPQKQPQLPVMGNYTAARATGSRIPGFRSRFECLASVMHLSETQRLKPITTVGSWDFVTVIVSQQPPTIYKLENHPRGLTKETNDATQKMTNNVTGLQLFSLVFQILRDNICKKLCLSSKHPWCPVKIFPTNPPIH